MTFGETAELAVLLKLKDEITGPLDRIDHSLSGLNSRAATVGGGLSKVGAGLTLGAERVAVGLIAIGGSVAVVADKATKAAATYQSAMELITTQAGATQAEVDYMSKALLSLAPQVGFNATELAAGLYHIESAGKRGAVALEALKTAAQGAKIGQADLEQTATALEGALNTGIKGTESMSEAMGTLNGIVGSGNMRMQDLVGAISTGILPTAKSMGLTLKDVGAAIADMTDQGVPAIDAATRLRMTFSLMAAPTSKAAKELEAIGMTSTQMAEDMRKPDGLMVALKDLQAHLSGMSAVDQTQAVSAMFGGGRTSSTILALLGSLDRLDSKYKAITSSTDAFGAAWSTTNSNIDEKKEQIAASIDALKIQLGQQLLPVEGKVLDAATKLFASPAVTKGIESFGTALAGMFTDENIAGAEKFITDVIPGIQDFATSVLPPLEEGLKITGAAAKQAFDMFMALPEPVKAAIIAGLAANKLTGGLVSSGIGDLARVALRGGSGGSGGGMLGGLGVQHVWVDNMGMGGGMGGAGMAASSGGRLSQAVSILGPVALAAGSIALLAATWEGTFGAGGSVSQAQKGTDAQISAWSKATTPLNDNIAALDAEVKVYRDNTGNIVSSLLLNTAANTQMSDALVAGAEKIANGQEQTPEAIAAIQRAIDTQRDMLNNRDTPEGRAAMDRLTAALLKTQNLLPSSVVDSRSQDATASRWAGSAGVKAAAQAAADASALRWAGPATQIAAEEKQLKFLQQRQIALLDRGDVKTASALGKQISALAEALMALGITVNVNVSARDVSTQQTHLGNYQNGRVAQ